MSDINKTLAERHSQHGAFMNQAAISQALSEVMRRATNYQRLTAYQRESLEMIQIKIARILEGNPAHIDHWHDIAGYATLVERALLWERERLQAKPAERVEHDPGLYADMRAHGALQAKLGALQAKLAANRSFADKVIDVSEEGRRAIENAK